MRLGTIWLGIVLFLTFFSNTIYSINLPGVTVGFASDGIITSVNRAEGILDFYENITLYSAHGGQIHFSVQEGDTIALGDALFSIYVEVDDLRIQLSSEQTRLDRVLLNRSNAQTQLQNLTPSTLRPTTITPPDIARFDHEDTRLAIEIERAEADYQTQRSLFEAGVVSLDTVTEIVNRIEGYRRNRQRNAEEREATLAAHQQAVERAAIEESFDIAQQQQAFEAERGRLQHEINLFNVDETEIRRNITRLNTQITEGGIITTYAEHPGTVWEILGELEDGMRVERNRLIMRTGVIYDNLYTVVVYFPESMGFLPLGTPVRVDIRSLSEFGLRGEIRRMTASQGRLRTEITFQTEREVTGGEGVTVIMERFSELFSMILPNSAIRQDEHGYFILYAEQERNTLLGYSYFARQLRIQVGQRGDRTSSVWMFLEPGGAIIMQSDRPIAHGSRVRLVADQ